MSQENVLLFCVFTVQRKNWPDNPESVDFTVCICWWIWVQHISSSYGISTKYYCEVILNSWVEYIPTSRWIQSNLIEKKKRKIQGKSLLIHFNKKGFIYIYKTKTDSINVCLLEAFFLTSFNHAKYKLKCFSTAVLLISCNL